MTAPLSRRNLLLSGSAAVAAGVGASLTRPAAATARPADDGVFGHGVASGDPLADRVILWTRVTPEPAAVPGSGVGAATPVAWEVATDPDFGTVVAAGAVTTGPDRDHTVKVDAAGLAPGRDYVYRFRVTGGPAAGAVSPTGRTRTAPPAADDPARLRFGVVSCANWEAGRFAAYRHLAQQPDLTAVLHLGDYYYEYATGEYTGKTGTVRPHRPAGETVTLRDYRIRHGQYRTDPDLAELHRRVPFICIWDDHESANDAWSGGAENHSPGQGSWAERRAASQQAYYEWLPVRETAAGHLYRRFRFGRLADLSMLDLRSYRDEQVDPFSAAVDDPRRTITGAEQLGWLTDGLKSSDTRWHLVGNSVMITPVVIPPLEPETTQAITGLLGLPERGIPYNADQWDGYTADRNRLMTAIRTARIDNVVFVTGDIHSSWACEIPVDAARYPAAGTVATELVVPSITSSNIDDMVGVPEHTVGRVAEQALRGVNRHIRYVELDSHGFGLLTVTGEAATMDYHFVADKLDPRSGARVAHTARVPAGRARIG